MAGRSVVFCQSLLLDTELINRLQKAFEEFNDFQGISTIVTGFTAAQDGNYDVIRDIML